MASDATSLPYDIVGHIIDILAAEGDLRPVKDASLTSSSLLHLCRRHIFYTITLNDPYCQDFKYLKKPFMSLLDDNPTIVRYIRELNYDVHHDDAELSPHLPNLLQTISHLECLRIRSARDNPERKFDWIGMDPLLRSALLRLMYLPTLTHFEIINVYNLPVSALAPCTNLLQLDIRHITVTPFEDLRPNLSPALRPKTPRILHLRNDSSHTAVGSLLRARWKDGHPVLDFTHLKRLTLDFSTLEDVRASRELFENVRHIEELHINGMLLLNAHDLNLNDLHLLAYHIHVHSLAGLSEIISSDARNLRILHVMSVFKDRRSRTIMVGLCEELEALAGSPFLQTLKFTFKMDGCESETVVETAFRKLEEVLMNPRWSALKCVSIEILLRCCYGDAKKLELKSVPGMYLSRLLSREILDYKCPAYIDFVAA